MNNHANLFLNLQKILKKVYFYYPKKVNSSKASCHVFKKLKKYFVQFSAFTGMQNARCYHVHGFFGWVHDDDEMMIYTCFIAIQPRLRLQSASASAYCIPVKR